jgi:hypothetical protein
VTDEYFLRAYDLMIVSESSNLGTEYISQTIYCFYSMSFVKTKWPVNLHIPFKLWFTTYSSLNLPESVATSSKASQKKVFDVLLSCLCVSRQFEIQMTQCS